MKNEDELKEFYETIFLPRFSDDGWPPFEQLDDHEKKIVKNSLQYAAYPIYKLKVEIENAILNFYDFVVSFFKKSNRHGS